MRGKNHYACALIGVLVLLAVGPALIGVPLQRHFRLALDERSSSLVSGFLGYPVRLIDVRPLDLNRAEFGLATIEQRMGKTLIASGKGAILLDDWRSLVRGGDSSGRLTLHDVAILEDLYQGAPLFAWASKTAFKDPIYARRVRLSWSRAGQSTSLRVLSFESEELLLHGGLRWEKGKGVTKAHAVIFIPDDRFENIPKELRARMIRRSDRWSGVRITFFDGSITVEGQKGPFFKARWG